MFTPEDIQNRVRQQPFRPLRIVTSAGQTFDVNHPELIMVGRRDLIIGRPSAENPTTYDLNSRIAIMHVTSMEDLPVPAQPTGNGEQ